MVVSDSHGKEFRAVVRSVIVFPCKQRLQKRCKFGTLNGKMVCKSFEQSKTDFTEIFSKRVGPDLKIKGNLNQKMYVLKVAAKAEKDKSRRTKNNLNRCVLAF